jgi:hypothetical protein
MLSIKMIKKEDVRTSNFAKRLAAGHFYQMLFTQLETALPNAIHPIKNSITKCYSPN